MAPSMPGTGENDDTEIRLPPRGGLFVWPFVLGCSLAGLAPGVDSPEALIKTPNSTQAREQLKKDFQ